MKHALHALETLMTSRSWQVLNREEHFDPTGPEALLVVAASSRELKAATTRLEDEHPLGRLWDIDVIDTLGIACSRRTLGLPARRCLLCAEEAHLCVRSRAHSLPELQQAVQEIVHAYRSLRRSILPRFGLFQPFAKARRTRRTPWARWSAKPC